MLFSEILKHSNNNDINTFNEAIINRYTTNIIVLTCVYYYIREKLVVYIFYIK